MATSIYTPEEVSKVVKATTMSGIAVAIADVGIVSTVIEMAAMVKELVGAAETYPNNNIIQAVFSEESLRKGSVGETPKDVTPENAAELALNAINEALSILTPKASPEEIQEYKEFVYSCANRVANAAGEGLFGTGKTKVSQKETATLETLKAALGL